MSGGSVNSDGTTETYPYGKASSGTRELMYGNDGDDVKAVQYALKKLNYYSGEINGRYRTTTEDAVKAFQKAMGITVDGIVGEDTRAKFKLKGYSTGGLVDYTGLAMVHGSPRKPEAFLNAEQTKALKENIFSGKNSLTSVLEAFNELKHNWQSHIDKINEDKNINKHNNFANRVWEFFRNFL